MKDIMCSNASCTKAMLCARFMAVPAKFQEYIFISSKNCNHYIPIESNK